MLTPVNLGANVDDVNKRAGHCRGSVEAPGCRTGGSVDGGWRRCALHPPRGRAPLPGGPNRVSGTGHGGADCQGKEAGASCVSVATWIPTRAADGTTCRRALRFGVVYSANITRHPGRGIGGWSDGDIAHLVRTGVARDGRYVPPWMVKLPHLADEDLAGHHRLPAIRRSPGGGDRHGRWAGVATVVPQQAAVPGGVQEAALPGAPHRRPAGQRKGGARPVPGDRARLLRLPLGQLGDDEHRRARALRRVPRRGQRSDRLHRASRSGRRTSPPTTRPGSEVVRGRPRCARCGKAFGRTTRRSGTRWRPCPSSPTTRSPRSTPISKPCRKFETTSSDRPKRTTYRRARRSESGSYYRIRLRFVPRRKRRRWPGGPAERRKALSNASRLEAWIRNAPSIKPDTRMPAWKGVIADAEYAPLAAYVLELGKAR